MAATSSTATPTLSEVNIQLSVKSGQCLIIDLESSQYSTLMRPMIECLKHSPLNTAFTISPRVPLIHLSTAYSTAVYNESTADVTFKIGDKSFTITKRTFSDLLGLPSTVDLQDPLSIEPLTLQKLFFQMGYSGDISRLSNFKKMHLPPMWNGLFTILFKSFSERTTGTDSSSTIFLTLMYGLYNGDFDFGSVIWTQLIKSLSSSTRDVEISYARFWAVIVSYAIKELKITVMKDSLMADRKSTRLNSSHSGESRMPSSA